jgi:hypothetical protein
MMGRLKSDQGELFYEFRLGDAVPEDHLVRKTDAALDLSWLRSELTPHYSSMGRPSIDTDNGSCYKSFAFRRACKMLGLKHIRTRLCVPKTSSECDAALESPKLAG